MNMMNCKKCNNQVPEDSQFCPFCGNQFIRVEIGQPSAPVVHATEPIAIPANTDPEAMLKRAFLFIEDGLFERADQYLEFILDQDPENAQAYLGKLMIDLRVNTQEQLAEQEQPFDRNGNYVKAVRFGDEKLVCLLNGYISQISQRQVERQNEEKYLKATHHIKKATSFSDLVLARSLLEELGDYRDSQSLLMKIPEVEETVKEKKEKEEKEQTYRKAYLKAQSYDTVNLHKAIELFERIPDWRDSKKQVEMVREKISIFEKQEQEQREKAKRVKELQIERQNRRDLIFGMVAALIPMALLIMLIVLYTS